MEKKKETKLEENNDLKSSDTITEEIEDIMLEDEFISENELIQEDEIANQRIFEIEYRLQELEIILDQLEQKVIDDLENEAYAEQYIHAKAEYKELLKERKGLVRAERLKDSSKANQISSWIYFYGIIIIIICFPFISYSIWLDFASLLIDLVSDMFSNIGNGTFLYYLVTFLTIFSLPLLLSIVSWMLYINLMRKPLDKKAFITVWIMQTLLSLGMIIYMSIILFGS